jgi:hypothetical protein
MTSKDALSNGPSLGGQSHGVCATYVAEWDDKEFASWYTAPVKDYGKYVTDQRCAAALRTPIEHSHHFVRVATSEAFTGPYNPEPDPFAWPIEQGGAINPAFFYGPFSRDLYLIYEVNSVSIGHGGSCGSSVPPCGGIR